MRRSYFNLMITIFLFGLLIACGKDYLDVNPQGSLDESSLANRDGVLASLVSTYSLLDGRSGTPASEVGSSGSNLFWGSIVADDGYKGSEPDDLPELELLETFNWTSDNPNFNSRFLALYEGISRSNATLRLLDAAADIPEQERLQINAEARFLRAHYHFEAYRLWKNIPYYREDDLNFKKANDVDVLPFIIEDLTVAARDLPETQEALARAKKTTAQAYLGKVYLYRKEYALAKQQLEAVVSTGLYALQDCFHELFSLSGENGHEMILSYQASILDGGNVLDQSNANPDVLAFPHNGGPATCCGFFQPSQNLVNAFRTDDQGLPLPDDFNDRDLGPNDFVDPRLDWTVGRDPVPFLNWGAHDSSWVRDLAYAGPYSSKKNGYYQGAGQAAAETGWGSLFSARNFHIFRYADLLLMLAECEVELGNLENARAWVNQIRSRAANCAQGPGTNIASIVTSPSDPNITWAKYRIGLYEQPWTDIVFARKAVHFERRLELAMEGHRLFDLRRWGTTREVMTEYFRVEAQKRNYLNGFTGYEDRHDLFPLPAIQVTLSSINGVQQMEQNPWY